MPVTLLALQVLLILLPGFAATYIVQVFAVRGPQTDFDKVIEASLYSVLIYGAFSISSFGRLPFELVAAVPPATEPTIHWHALSLIGLFEITLIVASLATLYINKDGNRWFRKHNLTERTTRRSVWNDILQGETVTDQIVQIEIEGNRSLIGVLAYWSDSADDGSLFVEQARWVSQDGSEIPVTGAGVLLTKEARIKSISLLDDPEKNPPDTASSESMPSTDTL
jgi:hypothetical protein